MIVHEEIAERDSELLYRVIFENTLDGLEVIDAETGRVVLANQAMAKIFGFTFPTEMIGLNPLNHIPTEDRDRVARMLGEDMFQKNLRRVMELRAITRDGREIWLSALGVRIEYQGRLAGLISVRDITVQKLAETRLQASEEEGHLLMQNSDEAVVVVQDGVLKFANPKAMAISGYSDKEMASRPFAELIHPDDRQIVAELYLNRLKGGETPHGLTFRAIAKEGRVIWFGLKVVSFTWEGKPAVWCFMKDISERKKAEEELQRKEQHFRALIENSSDGISVVDRNGTVLYNSPSIGRMLGYSFEERIGLNMLAFVHPDDIQLVSDTFVSSLQNPGTTQQFEVRLQHKDSTWRTIEIAATNLLHDAAVDGIVVNLRDITERKQADEELRESEKKFRAIFDNANDGFISADPESGRFFNPNRRMIEMLGYESEEEIRNLAVSDIHPREDLPRILGEFEKHARGEISRSEYLPVKRKDGSIFFASISSSPIIVANKTYLSCIFRDVTERRQAEETIRESEERLKILFEFAPDAYYLSDLEGNFIDGSRAAEQVMGYKKEELIGKNFFKLGLMFPDQAPRAAALLARNTFHQPTGPDEFILRRNDGSQVTVEINTFPVTIKQKAMVLGIARDITKRKGAEGELRNLSRRLVSLQEDERRIIARELHDEVGQSMTVLKLFLDRASPTEVGGNGTELRAARETLGDLMKQIRNMSLELRPTMLDDLGLLPTLLWHFKHYTARNHVQVDFKHAGLRRKLPPDVVNTAYRIVQEALTNVARHAQVSEVTVYVHAGSDALVLEIEDRGTGFQTDKKSPTSIGLSSMRERVLALNGTLMVESIPGRGTSLIAQLPLPAKSRKTKKETIPR